MIFDSHSHYDDEAFNEDREQVILRQKENGIVGILNCGSSLHGAKMSVELSEKYDFIYAAVGIHPEFASEFNEEVLKEIKALAARPRVKAIGEIGLDYYWEENPPKEVQQKVFRAQMKLAEELQLPVIIHDREAHEDTLSILKEYPKVKGVVHCFSGSAEFAVQCLALGYYIGITGVVTFKNARKIIEVAKVVPMDRLLIETDCPYMAPVPHRGQRNESVYLNEVIIKLAEIKDISPHEISTASIDNIKRLIKLPK